MIQPRQLRIGNFVEDLERNILTVKAISESKISVEENELKFSPNFINGIPLTYSTLISNDGFMPNDFPGFPDYKHLQRGDIIVRFSKSPELHSVSIFKHLQIELKTGEKTPVNLFLKRVRFVHEFQNAFVSLTGKELSLNKVDFQIG